MSHVRIMRPVGIALIVVMLGLAGTLRYHASSAPDVVRTFRVATFNIHKGADRQGHYDLERTIDAICASRRRPHWPAGGDAQSSGLQLRRSAGVDRRGAAAAYGAPVDACPARRAWITDDRQCLMRGRGSDVATEDLAFIAAGPILSSRSVRLSEGRVGLAVRVAAMPDVPVIVTHLAANRQNQPDRIRELAVLLPWAAQQGPGHPDRRLQRAAGRRRTQSGVDALPGCLAGGRRARTGRRGGLGIDAAVRARVADRLRPLRPEAQSGTGFSGGSRRLGVISLRRSLRSSSCGGHVPSRRRYPRRRNTLSFVRVSGFSPDRTVRLKADTTYS